MVFAFRVSNGLEAPARVRRQLRERLRGMLDAHTARDLELLVSEVVTNAVRYGRPDRHGDLQIRIEVDSEMINVHIVDAGSGFSPPSSPRPRFERGPGGFGLFLLDQLSSRWGVERDETGFRVWFRLPRPGTDEARGRTPRPASGPLRGPT
jgi:anti-sigma regulatory factor (Ser/Thr protein kinase)